MNGSEVADSLLMVLVAPTLVPPFEQSGLDEAGPQTKNSAVPSTSPLRAAERGDVDDRLAHVDARDVLPVLLDLGLDVRRDAGVEVACREVLELGVGLGRRPGLGKERAEARRLAAEHVG